MSCKFTLAVVIGFAVVCSFVSAQLKGTNTGVVSGVVEYSQEARTRAKVLLRDQNIVYDRGEKPANAEGKVLVEDGTLDEVG